MKKFAIVLGLIAATALIYTIMRGDSEPPFELEEGYRLLYNGTLDGWRKIGGDSTFEADGEDIVGRHGPGDNTFLRTEETFGNFSLKMQMRWDEFGNSGVLFRAQQRGGNGRAFGYQFELDHSDRAWSGGIYDEARRGWIANLENNQPAREAVRLNDWNDVEIEARGHVLKTWINGVPAADIVDAFDAEGYIALQVHSGNVGVMRWRHIRIKELPGFGELGDSLLEEDEWRVPEGAALSVTDTGVKATGLGEDGWLSTRRRFSDAMLAFSVPTCEDAPTTVQIRHRIESTGDGEYFAEVKVYPNRAEARLKTPDVDVTPDPVKMFKAKRHELIALARGGDVVLSIGQKDVLRLTDTGLYERGALRVRPADCGDAEIRDIEWMSLKDTGGEPLFYQTLDTPPAPVLTPEESLASFRIAPGFEIELVAAEPMVEDPVAMAWDEYGRLYVVELRGYMPDAYGSGSEEPVGQVVRLTDTDGDGRMDESEVFLGELVNPRAVAVVNEGVLIGEPPNLWLCELPTQGALCTSKRSIGGYATDVGTANVEHMENGLRQGLDNWLYNSKSARSLIIDNGELVERNGLYRGQWGITHDAVGRWLYNHNSTWVQADFFQGEDLIEGGAAGQLKGLGVTLTPKPEVYSVRVNPGVNRAYLDGTLREDGRLNTATGASGLVAYRGDQFPAQYHGDVFVPESAGNVVAQFDMAEEGIALTAKQRLYDDPDWGKRDFLGSTDERFRPVDAMNGPDGALYIIDMYRGIIQDDHFLTDELREQIFERGLESPVGLGRIWRVRHTEGAPRAAIPDLAAASDAELVDYLGSDNGWERETAQRLLLARGPEARNALEGLLGGEDTLAALHALWTLEGRDELTRDNVLGVVATNDTQRQIHALRAGRGLLTAKDLSDLGTQLAGAPEAVRMQLVFAMGDFANDEAVRADIAAVTTAGLESVYVRQAAVRAVQGLELEFLSEYLASGQLKGQRKNGRGLVVALGRNAYDTLRGDTTSTEPANPRLLELLALAESRTGKDAWQQIAMLKGFQRASMTEAFEAARLDAPPPIFTDATVGEDDPLWDARLSGRRAFTWPGDELALGITPLSPEQLQLMALGEAFYPQCGACHGVDGAGIDGLAPALAGASWVTGPPEWLGRIILQGMSGPVEVNGAVFDGVMPPHGHLAELDDATLAGLMTYLRRSWGNKADPVAVETVAAIREASADRGAPWTAEELEAVPFDRGFSRYVGQYSVSFITMTVSEDNDGLHLEVPMYGGGSLQHMGGTTFSGSAAGETVKLEFVVEEDGRVSEMILNRNGELIPVKRKD